jgi:hypothetical protein
VRLPEVLITQGNLPATDDLNDETSQELDGSARLALFAHPGHGGTDPVDAVRVQRQKWLEATSGVIDDHLRTNRRGYRYRRPGEYGGWNGPYLSTEIKGDPWGNRYSINSQWLDSGSSVADGQGRPRRAVFVVSAGANGVIETPFEQPVTDAQAAGDDIVIRIQ